MLHLVLYILLAIVVAVGLFLLASRFLPAGEQIAPPVRDEPVWELPAERSLRAEDVDGVRLPVALRGYRFAETDVLLDRLAGELRARDAEIARLRGTHEPSDVEAADVEAADVERAGVDRSTPEQPAAEPVDVADHARYAPPRPGPVAAPRPPDPLTGSPAERRPDDVS